MFNPLRLFRRKDYIDDPAAAYIEHRATDRDEAVLRERAAREPGLMEDLDSIRETVSLLRTIEPVKAPRSFALAEAPARVPMRTGMRRSRLAMAPAVFAIAAVAAVGLLAVGNLTDVVRQDDDASSSATSRTTAEDSTNSPAATSADGVAEGPPGLPGQPGLPGPPGVGASGGSELFEPGAVDPESAARSELRATASPVTARATGTPAARPTPAPQPTRETSSASIAGGELAPPPAGTPETDDVAVGPAGAPVSGTGESALALDQETAPARPDSDPSEQAGVTIQEPGFDGSDAEKLDSGEPLLLPQATVTGLFDPSGSLDLAVENPSDGAIARRARENGFALPLWQLQLSFASLAVLMAGAWFLLQRRLTA